MASNIILIGFMGAGKTVVGRRLAFRLNIPFVDIDREIELLVGLPVTRIFKKYGQIRFRSEEELMLSKICRKSPLVIATGGGAVLKSINRATMKKCGIVVWLQAETETIVERVGLGKGRPLLKGQDVKTVVQGLQRDRKKYYEEVAAIKVSTDGKYVDQIVDEIINAVGFKRS